MDENITTGFKVLSNPEIYALSREKQKRYWSDYKKHLIDEARAQAEKAQKEAIDFARKENEEKRKRANHVKYLLAGQLVAEHKDTVRLLICELAKKGMFTENEIIGLREMAVTADMNEEDIPVFSKKITKKKTAAPLKTETAAEDGKEA